MGFNSAFRGLNVPVVLYSPNLGYFSLLFDGMKEDRENEGG
jgi:hypothetical protein